MLLALSNVQSIIKVFKVLSRGQSTVACSKHYYVFKVLSHALSHVLITATCSNRSHVFSSLHVMWLNMFRDEQSRVLKKSMSHAQGLSRVLT